MKGVLQLWSCNYDPEPTGIAPVSTTLAKGLRDSGWGVRVIAAHPHYPEAAWGKAVKPYRERRDEIDIIRLPLWVGRRTPLQRIRQEVSYAAALQAALPALGRPLLDRADAMIVASPAFPALIPAIVNTRLRRTPWVLWLHDLLPDGAAATGQIDESGRIMRWSRRVERAAYRAADRIVTLSQSFVDNLEAKGVPPSKISLIYNPTTRGFPETIDRKAATGPPRILCMGNIGHTQGLPPLVSAFERSSASARLVVTGTGVAAPDVAAEVQSDRVELRGLVSDRELEHELRTARLGLVTQSYEGAEFNLPSKLMNYMAYGLPVVAAVNPRGEVARLVEAAGAGWVVDSAEPDDFPKTITAALADPRELESRGAAGRLYAAERFSPDAFAGQFERLLTGVIARPAG
jgi:colanic acid biosynthesis glycosyl transferase WcaI